MKRIRLIGLAIGLLAIVLATAACNSNEPGSSVLGRSGLGNGNDRVTVTADPEEIVIDLEDPERVGESTIRALIRDESGEPEDGVEVIFETDGGALRSGGDPVMTNEIGVAEDILVVSESDEGEVNVQATAGEDSNTTTVTVILNTQPVADAGDNQMAECGDEVDLDGSGSSDADSTPGTNDDIVSFEWREGTRTLGEGEILRIDSADLGVGPHEITLIVTDRAGVTASDDTLVTVDDDTPPEVTVSLDPSMIWPPNHKWVAVHATLHSRDACTSVRDLTVELLSVESNEPSNDRGDGNTEPDIMGVETGTADYDFSVRAERAGPGSGRIYIATYEVTDEVGNSTTSRGEARVPHDQGGQD